jgi:hypothetical protein
LATGLRDALTVALGIIFDAVLELNPVGRLELIFCAPLALLDLAAVLWFLLIDFEDVFLVAPALLAFVLNAGDFD